MGYSFRLKMSQGSWREVLQRLQPMMPPDLRVMLEQPEKGSKSNAPPLLVLFRDRLSTRGVELLEGGDSLTARIPAFATPEDVTLGLQIAKASAELLQSKVETLDGELEPAELLGAKLSEPMSRAQSGDLSALNAAASKGNTQLLPGAVRPFFIGPRLFGELGASTVHQGLFENVVAKFREVQWAHLRGYQPATIIGLRKGATEFTASAWAPGQAALFQPVDMLLLKAVGQPMRLPWAGLASVAQNRMQLLDEKQVLVDAFTEAEWPELIARAGNVLGAKN